MALLHQPPTPHDRRTPPPSSYDETQADIGASLFLGGVVMLVLLFGLIAMGLF